MALDNLKKIVVFGGTGAQGGSIVRALSEAGNFSISVLTRDVEAPKALKLKETYNVELIQGSYTSESGLRSAFQGQDACYFTLDSFSIGEPEEYFWYFRAYEIAVQSSLKLFISSGTGVDRFAKFGYKERYRNSHNIVSARLSGWLVAQPVERMPWVIIYGGVYAQMLSSLLRPIWKGDTLDFRVPMNEDSVIPLVPLDLYGKRVLWVLQNPEASVGKVLSCSPFESTFPQIAQALQSVSKISTTFENISIDEWMEGAKRFGINPEAFLPKGGTGDESTRFTFRKSFGAWWALWQDNKGDLRDKFEITSWADAIYPTRPRSLEEWMVQSNYVDTLKKEG